MIDLHTHTFFSDGELLPSELIQRARKNGYRALAITDHADISNLDFVIKRLAKVCAASNTVYKDIVVVPGVELTHVPPALVAGLVKKARQYGAKIVVFHGETVVEPVEGGSNLAAIKAGVDILAHPGNITEEEVVLAKKNNVCLEITERNGHNITNKHVAALAKKVGAKLVFDTDSHAPEDIADVEKRQQVLIDAGLSFEDIMQVIRNSEELLGAKGIKVRKA